MSGVISFKNQALQFRDWGQSGGMSRLAELVGPDVSPTISGYVGELDRSSIPSTLPYDEIILCMEGVFRVRAEGTVYELGPADAIWIPRGTVLHYEGVHARVFITRYPGDWQTRPSRPEDGPHGWNRVKLVRRADVTLKPWGSDGRCSLATYIDSEVSGTIGCSLSYFDQCSIPWTIHYDEFLVVIDGHYRMPVGDKVYEATPGDVLWLPNGTALCYEGDKALIFTSVYPVNWRARAQQT